MRVRHRRKSPHSARQRRGISAVELAMVAPLLFLFVFGFLEFGRFVMVQQSLTSGVREGCRKASLATTGSELAAEAAVRSYLQAAIPDSSDVAKVRVSMTPASLAGISPGTPITVVVEVNSSDVSWLPGNLLGLVGDPVLSARATQERE